MIVITLIFLARFPGFHHVSTTFISRGFPGGNLPCNSRIPGITEHRCSRIDRDIVALPVRLGGRGGGGRGARRDKPMS